MPSFAAFLLVVAAEAAAQVYHPAALDHLEQAPLLVLRFSPSAVRAPGEDMDLQALDSFARRREDRVVSLDRPLPWTLYGRLGLVNFKNELDSRSSGLNFSWSRTGPGTGGKKFSLGIRRGF